MTKSFCLECSTVYYKTIEAERLIEQWKTYAKEHNLCPDIIERGIETRTPKGHSDVMDALMLHIWKDH
jgi:hypothetical protein